MVRKLTPIRTDRRRGIRRAIDELLRLEHVWPPDAPGMPPPGENFIRHAMLMGDATSKASGVGKKKIRAVYGQILRDLQFDALRNPAFAMPIQLRPGLTRECSFLPGHIWGENFASYRASRSDINEISLPVTGPKQAQVMVVTNVPTLDDATAQRHFTGTTGILLVEVAARVGLTNLDEWYVTAACRFIPPLDVKIKPAWIAEGRSLLHQELRIVRPDYILCLGAEAAKAVLSRQSGLANYGDKELSVNAAEGRVFDIEFSTATHPADTDTDTSGETHACRVVVVPHPSATYRAPDMAARFERGLARFARVVADLPMDEVRTEFSVCASMEDAARMLSRVEDYLRLHPEAQNMLAWDAEWQGSHPGEPGAYLRCIQVSWREGHAIVFKLRSAGGRAAFVGTHGLPDEAQLARYLTEFVKGKRSCGHFLVADMEWLQAWGFDILPSYRVVTEHQPDRPAWTHMAEGIGGGDTAYMAHALDETGLLGLEALTSLYTSMPRYDLELQAWKKKHCAELKIEGVALGGYGDCDDATLFGYAASDADATLRIWHALLPRLTSDQYGNNCWEPYWESMSIQPIILEIHQQGMRLDVERVAEMTAKFSTANAAVLARIHELSAWPTFNVRSVQHVKEYLFGERYNGRWTAEGEPERIRPEGAVSLGVPPLVDTSKPPKLWAELAAKGKTDGHSPSTAKGVLGIMALEYEDFSSEIAALRDFRFLDQVTKTILRDPKRDKDGAYVEGEDGMPIWEKGLRSCVCADGMVRTSLYATAETGRWKSSRPNLQNISSQRDADYSRLLGEDNYRDKLRSIFMASPGRVFVEADYTGAELMGMAVMAGDANMISHAQRSGFADEGYDDAGKKVDGGKCPHPEYYDIHSNVAVLAFRLHCAPNKSAMKAAKVIHYRILAKNVIFGIAYGRGAKAIAMQARENRKKGDAIITVDEAQAVIDAIFRMYPKLQPFFADCQARVAAPGWLRNAFGRYRRFPKARDNATQAEFERQAQNFGIQGMIASVLDRGIVHLTRARDEIEARTGRRLFDWKLTIHDAILIECHPADVPYLTKTLIPYCMCRCVPIYPTDLDGDEIPGGPYYLGMDIKVSEHWGSKISDERRKILGLAL